MTYTCFHSVNDSEGTNYSTISNDEFELKKISYEACLQEYRFVNNIEKKHLVKKRSECSHVNKYSKIPGNKASTSGSDNGALRDLIVSSEAKHSTLLCGTTP